MNIFGMEVVLALDPDFPQDRILMTNGRPGKENNVWLILGEAADAEK